MSPSPAYAAPIRYEAEASPAVCTGVIESNWAGYSGTGFCNADNAAGAHAQFTVNASAAGTATLGIRFANGTATSRPAGLIVNGSTVQSLSFEGTGAWSAWATRTATVQLKAGSNTVRLDPTGSAGLPNLDHLDVEAGGRQPATALYVRPTATTPAPAPWRPRSAPSSAPWTWHSPLHDLHPRRHVRSRHEHPARQERHARPADHDDRVQPGTGGHRRREHAVHAGRGGLAASRAPSAEPCPSRATRGG
ncbi:CBM35 domain-containing protein [Nonomuraea rubra]|uniref:CBM35 domain-containing protein n=1 Tax=Nonomuraea rubra TaxID=46180 RepID=UPI0031EFA6BB